MFLEAGVELEINVSNVENGGRLLEAVRTEPGGEGSERRKAVSSHL